MLLVFKFRVIKRAVSRAQDEECFIIIVINGCMGLHRVGNGVEGGVSEEG